MSQSPTSLSLPARLLCTVGPPATILATGCFSYRAALLAPLAYSPTAWFYYKWRKDVEKNGSATTRADLEPLLWTYASASTVGILASAALQGVICVTATKFLFPSIEMRKFFWFEFQRPSLTALVPSEVAARAQLAGSWQNWAFNGVLSFLGAGLVEECLKLLPIVYARRRASRKGRSMAHPPYIDYALAAALGFSLVENIGFISAACESNESWLALAGTVSERCAGSVAHVLVASLTALRAVRQDREGGGRMSWLSVVGPAVLLHGATDMVSLSSSALDGNVGWVHPSSKGLATGMLGLIGGIWGLTGWMVSREIARVK